MNGNHDHEPVERVRAEDACPNCGERDMDLLVWDADGERVECQRCRTVYRPGAPAPDLPAQAGDGPADASSA